MSRIKTEGNEENEGRSRSSFPSFSSVGLIRLPFARATSAAGTSNQWVQATPGCASLLFLSQRPSAPDPDRHHRPTSRRRQISPVLP